MADLNVQPKQRKPWWPWLLLVLGIIALIFFLMRGCNNDKDQEGATDTTSAATLPLRVQPGVTLIINAPVANYEEIADKNISVRGNNKYAVYGLLSKI